MICNLKNIRNRNSISVCLPVYNRGQTLERALQSVSNQSYLPDEVIICDFNSRDDSRSIIKNWIARNNSTVEILYTEYDAPPEHAEDWNMTIRHASSDYFAILEGDDAWPPVYIEEVMRNLDKHPDTGMFFFPATNEKGKKIYASTGYFPPKDMLKFFEKMKLFAAPSQAVIKRISANKIPFLYDDKSFHYAPEMDLYFRITLAGYPTAVLTEPFVYRGIGKRKSITPLYYSDHFQFIEKYVKLKKISPIVGFASVTKIYLSYLGRLIKRCIKMDELNRPKDIIQLCKFYFKTVKAVLR